MTQLGHCVLTNKILGSVLSGRFISTETLIEITFLVRPFPLEHMFMFMIMLMLMILMLLEGTKLYTFSKRNRTNDRKPVGYCNTELAEK